MSLSQRILDSSLGLKYVMSVTGLLLVGFLVGHLSGNLLTFAGAEVFNAYAAKLKSLGPLLWVVRFGLLTIFCLHVFAALKLTIKNRQARPVAYASSNTEVASFASRTMPMTGMIVLAFLLYHLAHFTLHWIGAESAGHLTGDGDIDAYRMLVEGFQNPVNSGLYIVAMLLLGAHLSHGFSSLFQSLGLNHSSYTPKLKCLGMAVGWGLAIMFISIPVAVLMGCITL